MRKTLRNAAIGIGLALGIALLAIWLSSGPAAAPPDRTGFAPGHEAVPETNLLN